MTELFFNSVPELAAALALCDAPEAWRAPARRIALTGEHGEEGYVLQTPAALPGVRPGGVRGASEGDRVRFRSGDREALYQAADVTDCPTLWQAVPLQPAPPPPSEGVTWLAVPDQAAYREAVCAALLLGNDALGCLPLEAGALLRCERLSAFLAAKWAGRPGWQRYYACATEPRFLLPVGWDYPLAAKLALAPAEHDYCLMEPDGRWRWVRGRFEDVYDKIALDAGPLGGAPLQPAAELPRLRVELRLEPADTRERPRLWRLGADQRAQLDRLLALASEAELENLSLAAVQDSTGAVAWFLLDTLTGQSRAAGVLEGGRAWFARLPDEHLWLPVGTRLVPLPSRRSLIDSLALREDRLTLLDDAGDGAIRSLRVPLSAFRPLADLLDYETAAAAEEVEALLAAVTFDFDLAADPLAPAETGSGRKTKSKNGFWQRLLGR